MYALVFRSGKKSRAKLPHEPCETKSRSRPVPGMLLLTFRLYVTLTWMKFRMRIGPAGERTRQELEGRSRRRCFHESREKFACANTRGVHLLLSFFSFAFHMMTTIMYAKTSLKCELQRVRTRTSNLLRKLRIFEASALKSSKIETSNFEASNDQSYYDIIVFNIIVMIPCTFIKLYYKIWHKMF